MANTTECPHCGATLKALRVTIGGREMFCGYEPCSCAAAKAERLEELRRRDEEDRQLRDEEERLRLACIGIPPRYWGASHPDAERLCHGCLDGRSLYVHGPVGTGKTHLAAAVSVLVHRSERTVRFAQMGRILDEVKRAFGTGEDPLDGYRTAYLLVLDDLGKEVPTAFALERLFALVDYRYGNMLPTIVTTQYRPGELIARLGRDGDEDTAIACVSRLRDNCNTYETVGADRRLA